MSVIIIFDIYNKCPNVTYEKYRKLYNGYVNQGSSFLGLRC